jgi:hypothetical protein
MLVRASIILTLLAISDPASGRSRPRRQTAMDASVIVPLYVYPSAGAWEPVHEMYGQFLSDIAQLCIEH